MSLSQRFVALLLAVGVALAGPGAAFAQTVVGVTATEIKIGNTNPYSGNASAYGTIGKAIDAYFKMVNEQGGITIPWYAAKPIDDADPGTAMLVTGERVPLRQDAQGTASEAEEVSWDVVSLVGGLEPDAQFQRVKTTDGTVGFVATDKLRSLLDYRMIASSRDGKWSFTSLVAGD